MAVELNDTTIPATYQLAERTGTLPARNSMTRLSPGLRTRILAVAGFLPPAGLETGDWAIRGGHARNAEVRPAPDSPAETLASPTAGIW